MTPACRRLASASWMLPVAVVGTLVFGVFFSVLLLLVFAAQWTKQTSTAPDPSEPPPVRRILPTAHFRYLPARTRVVVTIDTAILPGDEKTPWDKIGERLYRAHLTPELKEVQPAITDLTSITVAFPHAGSPGGMVLLTGKVNVPMLVKQARACAELNRAMSELKGPTPIFRRPLPVEVLPLPLPDQLAVALNGTFSGSDVFFAALDDETVVMTTDPLGGLLPFAQHAAERAIRDAIKGQPRDAEPSANSTLLALLKERDPQSWLSVVLLHDCLEPRLKLILPEVDQAANNFKHLVATMREGKESELTLTATGKDIEATKEMEEHARENAEKIQVILQTLAAEAHQKQVLGELGKSVQIHREDKVLTVRWKIASEKMKEVFGPRSRTRN